MSSVYTMPRENNLNPYNETQFKIRSPEEHDACILKRYKGETDPKLAIYKAITEKMNTIETAIEKEDYRGIWKPARTSLFIIEHMSPETLIKLVKEKDPDSKQSKAALEKIGACVISKLPDEPFISKDGDDGAAARDKAAKKWLHSIEADDEVDDTECYEAQLYLHALCIEMLRRMQDLRRSAQLSCIVSQDNRFLNSDYNQFRPCYSETSGGVCSTAMFGY